MNKATVTWKLDMFGRVIYVCDANLDIIESVPALDDSYRTFKPRVAADNALMNQLSNEENGYAEHKEQVWEDLAKLLDAMCGGLRAYAKKKNKVELLAQAKFAPTPFLQKRGTEAIAIANNKLTLLNTNVENLTNYNVTAAKITAATNLVSELTVLNPKPTGQRSVDKALRAQLVDQIKETNAILADEIDDLMLTLAAEHPSFVEQYFNARRIQKTGIRHDRTEEEIAKAKEAAKAKKLKKEEEAKKQAEATESKTATQPEGTSDADGGQPDTNGSHPPTEADSGEPTGETA